MNEVKAATQEEQYNFVCESEGKCIQRQVELRKEMYNKYYEYCTNMVPNDCVAPLKRQTIERIISQVKGIVKKFGRKHGSEIINGLMA